MRFTELMINDWVYVDWVIKGNFQVTGIDKIEMQTTATSNYMGHEYAHPIPITPEILEANEFTKETVCNGEQRYLLHIGELCIIWANLAKSEYDIQTNKGRLQGIKLDSIHELQHALRLIGLNDFADNFKIMKGRVIKKEDFLEKFKKLIDEYIFDNEEYTNIEEAFERKILFAKESYAIELVIEKQILKGGAQ